METRPGIHLVSPQWSSDEAWPLVTLASGVALLVPVMRKGSALNWMAAAAGGVLAWQGVRMLRSQGRAGSGARSASAIQHLRQSIEVNAAPTRLTAMWRDSGVLDAVMQPWGSVASEGANRLRWTVDIPVHGALTGFAYKSMEKPGELVHWRTSRDSTLQIDEWFRVSPGAGNHNSQVTLEYRIDYSRIPGGAMLESLAEFFGSAPEALILNMLRKFKSLAEEGADTRPDANSRQARMR